MTAKTNYGGSYVQPSWLSFVSLPVYLTSPVTRILSIAFPLLVVFGGRGSFMNIVFSSESILLALSSWLERHYGSPKFIASC